MVVRFDYSPMNVDRTFRKAIQSEVKTIAIEPLGAIHRPSRLRSRLSDVSRLTV